jgi:ATP-dependent Lhr-like helicase
VAHAEGRFVDEAFALLHPVVGTWCDARLGSPTPPQRAALPLGLARRDALICSPTGTGKTLAAFLPLISRLADLRDRDELLPRPYVLYISPLRALGYDVEHNLRRPLREMGLLERPDSERAARRRGRVRERFVRTGVRTGDTPLEERRLMLARPPHVWLTTPESLALMLALESYRKHLRHVETVVVDEVHALAGNKRGAYLSLCLESLEALAAERPVRVGLSATVAPLKRIGEFLSGPGRPCELVDERGLRALRLRIEAPFAGAAAPLARVAQRCLELGSDARTQLVFTNVRSQAERLAHEMAVQSGEAEGVTLAQENAGGKRRDAGRIGIHHSALERSERHRIEARLRAGEVRAVVCSSSLELGVDIGFVDRVCIVGGARGLTPTLQRIGRAGHRPGAAAEGVVVAQDRDDILEAAATRRCIAAGIVDEIQIPEAPLDVLAQWLAGSVCPDLRVPIADALALARRAYPFRALSESDLREVVAYLSGAGAGASEAHTRRLGSDGTALYGLGREVCQAFFENVGTIPDESQVPVAVGAGKPFGKVAEGFGAGLQVGDVMLLAGKTFRVREVGSRGISVEPFAGRPNVPVWSSHLKGMPALLGREIGELRAGLATRLRDGGSRTASAWLKRAYGLEGFEAAHAVRYVAQQAALSAVPRAGEALIELYRMDRRQTAIFHTCAGRRANEVLARIVAARVFAEAGWTSALTTSDTGFMVALPPRKTLPDARWAGLLHANDVERDMLTGLRGSRLLRVHFRHVAATGLLVLRRAGGRTVRRGGQWSAEQIFERLAAAEPGFPLLRETLRAVTRDLLDAPAAFAYLRELSAEPRVLHPAAASPFSFGIVSSSFGDSVVLDDRAGLVEALHERVLALVGEAEPHAPDPAGPLFGGVA